MTELTRRALMGGLSASVALPAFGESAWPVRPIKMMVGFPAGGPLDVVSRIVAQALSRRLGQQVVVEGRPGASGTIAAAQVAHAQPDGYTLLSIPATYAASAALLRRLPYRPVEDFSIIGTTIEFPYVMVTYADHPIQTVPDLISVARSQNVQITYGTSGAGSLQHLSMELFASVANIKLQHIPYSGGAPAISELLGKRIDLVVDQPTALIDFVREGQLRALAVTGGKRFFGLPVTPTISEAGFPGYAVTGWQGLVGPADLPASVLNRLHAELISTLAEPIVVEQFRRLGNDPCPSSPGEFKARLIADIETWTKVVATANIERI